MKKKILCWFLAAMLAVPATVMAADEKQTELSENQRKATIMVLSISGNELTYIEISTGEEDSDESESEEMTDAESEEMTESESEEMSEPAGSAEGTPFDGAGGGPGAGGQMFQMGDMEEILEALQESGIDTSQMENMEEMFEALQESGIDIPQMENMEDMEEMTEPFGRSDMDMSQIGDNMEEMLEALQESGIDTSQMEEMMGSFMGDSEEMSQERPDMSQMEDMEDMIGSFGGNGGQMPQMGNMEDMLETFQNSGIDMSQMEEMMESFMGNIGGMSGSGDGMTWMGNTLEGSQEGFDISMEGSVTVYLQVGVVVHADDKEMTFSILEAGDELEVLFEADDEGNEFITEMWLLGAD